MDVKNILKYLLGIINAKDGIDLRKCHLLAIDENKSIEQGNIGTSVYTSLFRKYWKSKKLKDGNNIPVIVLPKIIESKRIVDEFDEEGVLIPDKGIRNTALIYIPASLSKEGKLEVPAGNCMPWMPIGTLKPFAKYVSIGSWERYSPIVDTEKMEWKEYWSAAIKLYEDTTESLWSDGDIIDMQHGHIRYTLYPEVKIIYDETVESTFHIRKLYYSLLEHWPEKESFAPLLKKLISKPADAQGHPYDEMNFMSMKEHLGTMSSQYTMSPSQRESLHHLKEIGEGDVLAVSGPPGTGKTTLLQSVVADMMVEHAINEKRAPIIVATSTNNKAVVNVIDSFANVSKGNQDKIGVRWTKARSLAVFLPSSTQKENPIYKDYFKTSKTCEDDYALLEGDREKMIEEFKSNYKTWSGKELKIGGDSYWRKVSEHLLSEMKARRECMTNILYGIEAVETQKSRKSDKSWVKTVLAVLGLQKLWYFPIEAQIERSYKELERRFEKLSAFGFDYKERLKHIVDCLHKSEGMSGKTKLREVRVSELNGVLDITLRYQMFWLAVHYYEAKWLSGESLLAEKDSFKTTRPIQDKRLHRMAMLSPCMVMTFFMLPNVFELYTSKREEFPYYQDVDLLIVDEAGQVSPEVAIPSFSLAKRAIVVGDVYQIPPVWSVDLDIDLEMARNCHTATGNTTKEEFAKRDLNCSSSSLMKLASSVCRFQRYENNRGLFLKEHRRCFEEIITFCNELIYNKIRSLEPLRPDGYEEKKGKLLGSKCPAMGHVSVEHLKSESKDGSRHCQQEADSIANWLADNFKKIKEVYIDTDKDLAKMKEGTEEYAEALKKAIGNAVSVITPFKQQTYDVKIALQNKAQESKINELAVIPCGTVHTFQGAESRIVIFSTVYGKNEPWKFIKDNENLINVAVSRAKDYFFTFGERSIAGGGDTSDNAAQLLLDYTCSEIPKKLVEDKT